MIWAQILHPHDVPATGLDEPDVHEALFSSQLQADGDTDLLRNPPAGK